MDCPFQVGQKVVCVDVSPAASGNPCPFKLNAVYEIEAIGPLESFLIFDNQIYLAIKGIDDGRINWRWQRFRALQIKKTDISVFTEILDKINKKAPVDA